MKKEDIKTINDKFFTDPDWHLVEELIKDYINPLTDLNDIDVKETADNVKAQVVGRRIAYEQMTRFLTEAGILREKIKQNKSFE